jgi:hypothetical protein
VDIFSFAALENVVWECVLVLDGEVMREE